MIFYSFTVAYSKKMWQKGKKGKAIGGILFHLALGILETGALIGNIRTRPETFIQVILNKVSNNFN